MYSVLMYLGIPVSENPVGGEYSPVELKTGKRRLSGRARLCQEPFSLSCDIQPSTNSPASGLEEILEKSASKIVNSHRQKLSCSVLVCNEAAPNLARCHHQILGSESTK